MPGVDCNPHIFEGKNCKSPQKDGIDNTGVQAYKSNKKT